MNDQELTHIDLFSGIGGFTLAGEWAGFRTIVFCEKDEFCQKVLKKHWPEIPIVEDIRDFDGTKWRGATLLTGGFPCQPFSVAGPRTGTKDDRYLWPEMLRIIKEAKPTWIIAENVSGIVKMALGDVLSNLESIGYDFPRDHRGTPIVPVIPACSLNAPHRRSRIWLIAYCKGRRVQGRSISIRQGKSQKATCNINRSRKNVADSFIQGFQNRNARKDKQGPHIEFDRESSGYNRDPWAIEPDVGRVAHGIPDRVHRLKALGNAIVPQIAYEILKRIAWIERNERAAD